MVAHSQHLQHFAAVHRVLSLLLDIIRIGLPTKLSIKKIMEWVAMDIVMQMMVVLFPEGLGGWRTTSERQPESIRSRSGFGEMTTARVERPILKDQMMDPRGQL